MIPRVKPDLGRRGDGVEVHQVGRLKGGHARRGQLVTVEVDDRRLLRQGRHQLVKARDVERFTGEQEIEVPHPVPRELLGEPVAGRRQPALDAAWRQLQDRPAVPAASNERLQHRTANAAEERLQCEDVQLR